MIRVTTLVENKIGEHLGLESEHGLSFFVEADGKKILFDTGQSDMIIRNAKKLNIDLSKVDTLVLSHGHYDHTGGTRPFIQNCTHSFSLYAHPDLFVEKYRIEHDIQQFLGNDFKLEWLEEQGIKVNFVKQDVTAISENVYIVSNFERKVMKVVDNPLYKVYNGKEYVVDDFHDEIAMVLRTTKGLVVLLGCSHVGVDNIIKAVMDRIEGEINTIIGGTHLVVASKERLEHTVDFLETTNVKHLGVSHCTGDVAVTALKKRFSERYYYNCAGTSIQV